MKWSELMEVDKIIKNKDISSVLFLKICFGGSL